MTEITLYTGSGVSFSPHNAEGRRASAYVRLMAEPGKGITDGITETTCVDVSADNVSLWADCELHPITDNEEAQAADYEEALGRFGV